MEAEAIKNSIQAVVDGLTPLAQKLQVPIEGIFRWSIKHNYAVAIAQMIPFLVGVIMAIFCVRWLMKNKVQKILTPGEPGNPYQRIYDTQITQEGAIVIALTCISAGLLLFGGGVFLSDGLMRLIAPEWFAADDIIRMIKR